MNRRQSRSRTYHFPDQLAFSLQAITRAETFGLAALRIEPDFDGACPRCGERGFVFACGHRCPSCGFKAACDD